MQALQLKPTLKSLWLGAALSLSIIISSPLLLIPSAQAETLKAETAKADNKISHYTLDNGLELVVIPDNRAPVVTHMVWYKVGSADEVAGKSGIAHFLEHLMFKGTSTYKDGEFSKAIAAIGGSENAFTSFDYTAYFQRIAPEALEQMMVFEADRMENLTLTDETVLPEREVILEERRSRIDSRPSAILAEAVNATLFQNHRYGIPIIGWEHEMQTLNKEDAIKFYNQYYTPNNAIVVVAGDVKAEAVKALAQATYGKVARRAEPGKRQRVKEPKHTTHRKVELFDQRVTTPSWQRQYLAPSYFTAEDGDAEALEVLAQIMGEGPTSRLYKKLIIEKKIAANVGAFYRIQSIDDTSFGFYGSPQDGIDLKTLEKEVELVIEDLLKHGVSDEEVKRAQNRTIIAAVYEQDSQQMLANIYGSSLTAGASIEEIQGYSDRVKKVTKEDVMKVARKYLVKTAAVSGYLFPQPQSQQNADQ